MKYLEAVESGKSADEATMQSSQRAARLAMLRMTRGTNSLPWFKDPAYYNGTVKMWKQFEEANGDYETIMLSFLGKADPTLPEHRRLLLETHSV